MLREETVKCCKQKSMDSAKLHIAMFPWLAFGHFIPFLQLANDLAKRGHRISLLLPTNALLKLKHMNLYPQLITLCALTIPQVEGLPPGADTTADTNNLDGSLTLAFDGLQDEVKSILLQMEKPNLVLYDHAYWIPDLVLEMGCKTVWFTVVSPTVSALCLLMWAIKGKGRAVTAADLMEAPPGFPSDSKVVLREQEAYQVSRFANAPTNRMKVFDRIGEALKRCDAIAFRTCNEMEGQYCNYIATKLGKPVYCTGPLLPEPPREEAFDGEIARWLDKFEPNSVIFCAFGSELALQKEQFHELVLGLELTGLPFLVAIKPPEGSSSIEDALPEGFEERIKGKAIVHGGWVPQSMILRHKAVGYFVNHGGSASMRESLASHCRIIVAPPNRYDLTLNARLMAEELEAAVEVQRDENGRFFKENLCNAIKSVMGENIQKVNHKKWKDLLHNPNFADNYIDNFIHNLYELLAK
ncbi:PREDICTED: anthocyanidin 3-O-glucoside 2'''-O-xylosyltransferase-like isoform X3 [Ipomoea nil]|uniref:anthocyanidin 3-O-glucoside 2'''-O-xylosyltransferase-like isoform X3 n=1 Tax=Ipomoea nil TaxID=35883 RepID=UPI00090146BF|nr:PREDICTED: anthocyanidin 3-O-glucoside 2'''-O-xylosyltransferase-like isoform X3 [Ipomoea nil]